MYVRLLSLDSCLVRNGGCDPNATCSHNAVSNGVQCTCNTGFKNIGVGSQVRCIGMLFSDISQILSNQQSCELRQLLSC